MVQTSDVLIVGGGISGISLAARLAPHLRVTVLEAEDHLGVHATGRSAAILIEAYGPPEIRALTRLSRSFFEQPPEEFSEAPLAPQRRGCLVYAGEGGLARLESEFARAAHVGDIAWLDAAATLAAAPLLRPGVAAAGFIEPNALDLDAAALLAAFARAARGHGASILTGARVEEVSSAGGDWRVVAGGHAFSAAILVNAAGAWADGVAELAGIRPRKLVPRRRTAATIPVGSPLAERLAGHPFVAPIDDSYYFKPETGAVMVSLSDETPSEPCDAFADDIDVATALDRFHAATIVPPARPTATWAGLRTFAPDRLPVVGFDREAPGFFWYAGQGGYGIQTSPALSAMAARLLLGSALDAAEAPLADALDPARPALVSPS